MPSDRPDPQIPPAPRGFAHHLKIHLLTAAIFLGWMLIASGMTHFIGLPLDGAIAVIALGLVARLYAERDLR